VAERDRRVGRGIRREYEVKWKGYYRTTFEPAQLLENTVALDRWLSRTAPYRNAEERLPTGFREGKQVDP